MRAHLHIRQRRFNLGHMADNALAAGGARAVMGMLFERGRPRAIRRTRAVARKAELVLADGRAQLRVVGRAVNVVAAEARYAPPVHHALHEVVPLHAILVRGAVGEMRERRLAQRVFFELSRNPAGLIPR